MDVDIPFEKPINCEHTIETENKEPAAVAEEILKKIKI